MKHTRMFAAMLLIGGLAVGSVACGGKKEEGEEKEGKENASGSEGGGESGPISCDEENKISIEDAAGKLEGFTLQKTVAMKSGWTINAKKKSERIMVYMANYDMELGMYAADMTKDSTHYVIEMSFSGKHAELDADMVPMEAGVYAPGTFMDDNPVLDVRVFNMQRGGSMFTNPDKVVGTAEITNLSDKKVCGRVNFKDESGNMIEATFSAPIEKDISDQF